MFVCLFVCLFVCVRVCVRVCVCLFVCVWGEYRLQPVSGKVSSVSQVEQYSTASSPSGEEEMLMEGDKEEDSSLMKEKDKWEEGEREGEDGYSGGRFAGVGEFEPAVQRQSKKKRVAMPLFKAKSEASLRSAYLYPFNSHCLVTHTHTHTHTQTLSHSSTVPPCGSHTLSDQ